MLTPIKEGTPIPGGSGVLPEGCMMVNAHGADRLMSTRARSMLRACRPARFAPDEVAEFRLLGLDFEGARTRDDAEQALASRAGVLADERPDLRDKGCCGDGNAEKRRAPLATDRGGQRRAFFRFSLAILIQRSAIWSR